MAFDLERAKLEFRSATYEDAKIVAYSYFHQMVSEIDSLRRHLESSEKRRKFAVSVVAKQRIEYQELLWSIGGNPPLSEGQGVTD